jgi:sporulation protein YtfJ
METHPIDNLMKSTMENLKDMIDVNTIVGDSVITKDGALIIPISKVSFGFVSGGTEFDSNKGRSEGGDFPFGGGSGAGFSIKPVAFLVIKGESIRLLSVDDRNTYDKIVDTFPQILDVFKDIFRKDKTVDADVKPNLSNDVADE